MERTRWSRIASAAAPPWVRIWSLAVLVALIVVGSEGIAAQLFFVVLVVPGLILVIMCPAPQRSLAGWYLAVTTALMTANLILNVSRGNSENLPFDVFLFPLFQVPVLLVWALGSAVWLWISDDR